jgi:hypothetical protein
MNPIQLTLRAPHWLMGAIALVGTIAPQIGQAFPTLAPICQQVSQVTPLVLAALGITSGSGLATPPKPPSTPVPS